MNNLSNIFKNMWRKITNFEHTVKRQNYTYRFRSRTEATEDERKTADQKETADHIPITVAIVSHRESLNNKAISFRQSPFGRLLLLAVIGMLIALETEKLNNFFSNFKDKLNPSSSLINLYFLGIEKRNPNYFPVMSNSIPV